MENNSGAVLAVIILGICLAVFIIIKIASYFARFNAATRYLSGEMSRAFDDDEYLYWRRELRCHYLELIPFVNSKNVMRLYSKMFDKADREKVLKRSEGISHMLAPSIIALCVCVVCLCGASWAWFTATATAGTEAVKASEYQLYFVDKEESKDDEIPENGYNITVNSNYEVTLKAQGTTGASGYAIVKVGTASFYTDQIKAGETYSFTITATEETAVNFTAKWGSCSSRTASNTIANGGTIGDASNAANDTDKTKQSTNSASKAQSSETFEPVETEAAETSSEYTEETATETTTVAETEATTEATEASGENQTEAAQTEEASTDENQSENSDLN